MFLRSVQTVTNRPQVFHKHRCVFSFLSKRMFKSFGALPSDWIRFNLLSLHRGQVHRRRNVFSACNPSLVIKEQCAAVMHPESNWGFSDLQLMESGDRTDDLGVAGRPPYPTELQYYFIVLLLYCLPILQFNYCRVLMPL